MTMRSQAVGLSFLAAASVLLGAARAADKAPLTAEKPIMVPGGPGGYDWMLVDKGMDRVLAAHKGTKMLAVLDLKTGKVTSVPTGEAQGIGIDEADNKYFIGDAAEEKIVVIDRKTLKPTGEVKVAGPVDAVAFNPKNGCLYADHDDGKDVWVIDGKTEKMVGTVAISGAPEWIEYDARTDKLYQNIKEGDTLAVIAPATNTVSASYSTVPATGPHGLALDSKTGRLFSAGKNGKMVVLDMKTGKILATVPTGTGVDQIAFDAQTKRIYCGCKGVISVAQETTGGATLLADVPQPAGAHTLTVDPTTHSVWISYADSTNSYLQEYKATK